MNVIHLKLKVDMTGSISKGELMTKKLLPNKVHVYLHKIYRSFLYRLFYILGNKHMHPHFFKSKITAI